MNLFADKERESQIYRSGFFNYRRGKERWDKLENIIKHTLCCCFTFILVRAWLCDPMNYNPQPSVMGFEQITGWLPFPPQRTFWIRGSVYNSYIVAGRFLCYWALKHICDHVWVAGEETAAQHRELSSVLRDDLEGRMGERIRGRGYMHTFIRHVIVALLNIC